jgi:hypothetical protein
MSRIRRDAQLVFCYLVVVGRGCDSMQGKAATWRSVNVALIDTEFRHSGADLHVQDISMGRAVRT